ncbi:hypothetical protein OSB04_002687 [Centaurea solstitialis]|uniref:Uncharacterized protein n=1 Tax=Centaurea solstitialis TaxID=347529 RepID=A0AA38WVE7_9ASTR|nr:hypothetical protein OSB04_002687 [Centaurea solstitialis]
MKQQMDSSSLRTFLNIAYQCLERSREKRPPMIHVVEELEIALKLQDIYKEWFSLNKHGEHCAMVSATECIPIVDEDPRNQYVDEYKSR